MADQPSFKKLHEISEMLRSWNEVDGVRGIAAECGDLEGAVWSSYVGHDDAKKTVPVDNRSRFLIASPTKPIVATAAMMLVEQGEICVSDHVSKYIHEFGSGEKADIRIAHLLTHTSGLPDMLPNNEQLRRQHAPLTEYQRETNRVELVYAPGTRVHYQSTGILTLSTIIEFVSGQNTRDFLEANLFSRLGMSATELGTTDDVLNSERPPVASMVEELEGHDQWGWNSVYWRKLGAPWGGLIANVEDLGTFCRQLLQIHAGHSGLISNSTLKSMTTNQLATFPKLRPGSSASVPWGYGWQLNWPNHPRGFGSVLSQRAYGHWGATGTLVWIDPEALIYGVILTNEPMGMENRRPMEFANSCRAAFRST